MKKHIAIIDPLTNIPVINIPRLLVNDKKTKGNHIFIFSVIFHELPNIKTSCITNLNLSKQARIGLRQLKHALNELEEWGYIIRTGNGSNRQFSLGEKLHGIK